MPPHMPAQCTPEASPSAAMAAGKASSKSDDLRIRGARFALAKVAVEHHADGAHEQPAARRHRDPVGVELDEAVAREAAQVGELGGEVLVEIDEVRKLDRLDRQAEV